MDSIGLPCWIHEAEHVSQWISQLVSHRTHVYTYLFLFNLMLSHTLRNWLLHRCDKPYIGAVKRSGLAPEVGGIKS